MSELDELVSRHGVLMAGRFGPDWRVAETKSKGLFVEFPPALEVMGTFCVAIKSMFDALTVAMGGFSLSAWTPVHWLGRFWRHLLDCRTRRPGTLANIALLAGDPADGQPRFMHFRCDFRC